MNPHPQFIPEGHDPIQLSVYAFVHRHTATNESHGCVGINEKASAMPCLAGFGLAL
jgi:hypothetical protein